MKIKKITKSGIKPTWDIEVNEIHEYLLENGGYKGFQVSLQKDSNEKQVCKIKINVMGIYNGSQVNKELEGFITSFIVNNGKLLTYEAREGSPF